MSESPLRLLHRIVGPLAILIALAASAAEGLSMMSDYVEQPVWVAQPTPKEIVLHRPKDLSGNVMGVRVECRVAQNGTLRACRGGDPTSGVGQAASRFVSTRYRMASRDRQGKATANRPVIVTLSWLSRAYDRAVGGRSLIMRPDWVRLPAGEELARHFPQAATAARAGTGATSIVCGITVKGTLTACQVVEESPRGLGFGQASLRLAPYFRMKPTTADGQPIDTRAVIIPIRWERP